MAKRRKKRKGRRRSRKGCFKALSKCPKGWYSVEHNGKQMCGRTKYKRRKKKYHCPRKKKPWIIGKRYG